MTDKESKPTRPGFNDPISIVSDVVDKTDQLLINEETTPFTPDPEIITRISSLTMELNGLALRYMHRNGATCEDKIRVAAILEKIRLIQSRLDRYLHRSGLAIA